MKHLKVGQVFQSRKTFAGKIFNPTGYYGTKSQCQGEAKLLRRKGYKARVVKAGREYGVWFRSMK